jgi:hypothetical protein
MAHSKYPGFVGYEVPSESKYPGFVAAVTEELAAQLHAAPHIELTPDASTSSDCTVRTTYITIYPSSVNTMSIPTSILFVVPPPSISPSPTIPITQTHPQLSNIC